MRECGSHSPLEDRQARLSGAERENIDARRQNLKWSQLLRYVFLQTVGFQILWITQKLHFSTMHCGIINLILGVIKTLYITFENSK